MVGVGKKEYKTAIYYTLFLVLIHKTKPKVPVDKLLQETRGSIKTVISHTAGFLLTLNPVNYNLLSYFLFS